MCGPNFLLGIKIKHNAKKSVLYVSQHPTDTVAERPRGSIKLNFHTKALGMKRRIDGTGHFEPFCRLWKPPSWFLRPPAPSARVPTDKAGGRAAFAPPLHGAYSGVMSNFQSFSTVKNLHVTVGCGMNGRVPTRNI